MKLGVELVIDDAPLIGKLLPEHGILVDDARQVLAIPEAKPKQALSGDSRVHVFRSCSGRGQNGAITRAPLENI